MSQIVKRLLVSDSEFQVKQLEKLHDLFFCSHWRPFNGIEVLEFRMAVDEQEDPVSESRVPSKNELLEVLLVHDTFFPVVPKAFIS